MQNKPVSPTQHGSNDYVFTAIQYAMPTLLGFNSKAKKVYALLGSNLLLYNALTDYKAGVAPVIPYKTHKVIDIASVAGLALLSTYKGIRKQKNVLAFHLAFTALATLHIYLTDWGEKTSNG